jgi:superfamily II DNA or RNA helicase
MIKLRPYQQQAVDAMTKHKRAICVAPAGSGKTIIAAKLIDTLANNSLLFPDDPVRVEWIAHTQEQCQQASDALYKVIYTGEAYTTDVITHVCCYASRPDLSNADIVIVDECHWAGCAMLQEILATASPNARVYGFTATPKREDGVDITEIIGPIAYTVDRAEIQAVGGVLPAEVRVVEFGARDTLDKQVDALAQQYYTRGMRWLDMRNGGTEMLNRCVYRAAVEIGVRGNPNRDRIVASLAHRHATESVIVLVDSKEHGKRLESLIDGSVFVASGTAGRSRKIDAFRAGELRCIIATSILEEGFDGPIASVLILAGTGKSFRKTVQATGRVLRPCGDKQRGIIYDILDLGHGMIASQHWQRRRVYKELGYRVVKDN